jgi:hypothetical protein
LFASGKWIQHKKRRTEQIIRVFFVCKQGAGLCMRLRE